MSVCWHFYSCILPLHPLYPLKFDCPFCPSDLTYFYSSFCVGSYLSVCGFLLHSTALGKDLAVNIYIMSRFTSKFYFFKNYTMSVILLIILLSYTIGKSARNLTFN